MLFEAMIMRYPGPASLLDCACGNADSNLYTFGAVFEQSTDAKGNESRQCRCVAEKVLRWPKPASVS